MVMIFEDNSSMSVSRLLRASMLGCVGLKSGDSL